MSRFSGWDSAAVERLNVKTDLSNQAENIPRIIPNNIPKENHPDYTGKIITALNAIGIKAVREYKFLHDRRFRFDIAIPEFKIAIEFEGNIFPKKCTKCNGKGCKACDYTGKSIGRHTRGKGYSNDAKKYNLATMHGWKLLRYTSDLTNEDNWEFKIAAEVKDLIETLSKGEKIK